MKIQIDKNMSRSQPAPKEIVAARHNAGLTQTQASALVYSSCRAWQKWESGEVRMNPAVFELFLIKTNQVLVTNT